MVLPNDEGIHMYRDQRPWVELSKEEKQVYLRKSLLQFVILAIIFVLIGFVFWRVVPQPGRVVMPPAVHSQKVLTPPPEHLFEIKTKPAAFQMRSRYESARYIRAQFRLGVYGRYPARFPYSRQFKLYFVAHARGAYHRVHPHRGFSGVKAWRNFTAHDTCSSLRYKGPLECGKARSRVWDPALNTPYWRRRSSAQNLWTTRVLYCGATYVLTYAAPGATAIGALGSGAALCFAGLYVK